jgi:outer membrane protein OmpA-like peptidoglycan-associated protein
MLGLAGFVCWQIPTTREDEESWRQRELAFLKSAHDRIQAELAHQTVGAASLRGEQRSILDAMDAIAKPMSSETVPADVKVLLSTAAAPVIPPAQRAEPERRSETPTEADQTSGAAPPIRAREAIPAAVEAVEPARAEPIVVAATSIKRPQVDRDAPRTQNELEDLLNAEKTARGLRIRLPADTLFGTTRNTLDSAAGPRLEIVVELIKAIQPREIVVLGHTDTSGKRDVNLAISKERAKTVSEWLTEHGVDEPPHLIAHGYGSTRPLAPNENADGSPDSEGRARNRRIEILLRRQ